ncbi:MAG TPA: preprotein translocase subunit YajC [Thermomicrobiaceae bacterium]|nr:preprotein translocase subunit YajC [Thermomicrobiaceae bacterium]
MNYLPYVVVFAIFVVLALVTRRNRRRQVAAEQVRVSQIGAGSQVMTTSGLYGTVVRRDDDGTVLLAIAPGVEVKWAIAALREADSLPERYRRAMPGDEHPGGAERPGAAGQPDANSG